MKMLNNVQMKDRDSVWNQIHRDVRRSNDIWSKIDRENKLNTELTKNKSRLSSINKI